MDLKSAKVVHVLSRGFVVHAVLLKCSIGILKCFSPWLLLIYAIGLRN